MAHITIIGGHGKVGLLLAPLLVEAGHEVTSVIRNPDHSDDIVRTGATPLVADVSSSDTDSITEILAASDAVVWSAGAGGGSAERTYAVDRDAAIRSIDAAVAAEARRYLMVSYFGAGPDHGVDPSDDFFAYAESKAAADEHLQKADLDWTILAPSALTLDEPTGRIDADADEGTSVSRADVAAVIAAALADPSTIGRTISFNNGDQPIAEAISA
ncbi:SDR family oxidoreductase [Microbacterium oleivorans]|uniref:NAD-dependent epimerase/dehydratase n=1 Tax=Microbacterium oleivorans TaxID=273677 RepID=A0A031FP42_9MICO|nr:SDR family oxidoreductase [Microbacterium oleivorans]EZP25961.1 NAD-dependent epimerase/dehydratase [Microbacterium oleivorans]